jgi:hypothetical protein
MQVPITLIRLMKFGFSRQTLVKSSGNKCHKNQFNGSSIVACGQTDRQTKLIVVFRSFVNASKNTVIRGIYR